MSFAKRAADDLVDPAKEIDREEERNRWKKYLATGAGLAAGGGALYYGANHWNDRDEDGNPRGGGSVIDDVFNGKHRGAGPGDKDKAYQPGLLDRATDTVRNNPYSTATGLVGVTSELPVANRTLPWGSRANTFKDTSGAIADPTNTTDFANRARSLNDKSGGGFDKMVADQKLLDDIAAAGGGKRPVVMGRPAGGLRNIGLINQWQASSGVKRVGKGLESLAKDEAAGKLDPQFAEHEKAWNSYEQQQKLRTANPSGYAGQGALTPPAVVRPTADHVNRVLLAQRVRSILNIAAGEPGKAPAPANERFGNIGEVHNQYHDTMNARNARQPLGAGGNPVGAMRNIVTKGGGAAAAMYGINFLKNRFGKGMMDTLFGAGKPATENLGTGAPSVATAVPPVVKR